MDKYITLSLALYIIEDCDKKYYAKNREKERNGNMLNITKENLDSAFKTVDGIVDGARIIGDVVVDGFGNSDSRRNLRNNNYRGGNQQGPYSQIPSYGYGYADNTGMYDQYGSFNFNTGSTIGSQQFGYPGFYDPTYGKGGNL